MRAVDGEVTHEFTVIDAVGAELTEAQVNELSKTHPNLTAFPNGDVDARRRRQGIPTAEHPTLVGADTLHGTKV